MSEGEAPGPGNAGYAGMGLDTGDRCREARGLEVEGEACLDLFFLCFLELPECDDNDLDLDVERPWERIGD